MRISTLTLTLLFITLAGGSSHAASILFQNSKGSTEQRTVSYVFDGDTFATGEQRYRLWGIDTPEKDQPYADIAKSHLIKYLSQYQWRCLYKDTDRYNRFVVHCTHNGDDLNAMLVEQGLAKDFTFFSKGYFKPFENQAKKERLNLWSKN